MSIFLFGKTAEVIVPSCMPLRASVSQDSLMMRFCTEEIDTFLCTEESYDVNEFFLRHVRDGEILSLQIAVVRLFPEL